MTGYEFIRAVRQTDWGAGLFAVAMTGYAQPEDRLQAAYAGFDAHLAKLPSFDELARVLLLGVGGAIRSLPRVRDESGCAGATAGGMTGQARSGRACPC